MRLIDAEWLMNFFVDIPDNFTLTIGNLRATVNEAPSIDIVPCQDCKHKQQCRKAVEHITHEPTSVTIGYKSVDFCSYGERKVSEVPTGSERSE